MAKRKKLPYGAKGDRVRALLAINPDMGNTEIAKRVGCHRNYVKQLREQEYRRELESLEAQGLLIPFAEPEVDRARDIQVGGNHYKTKAVQPWDVYDTWPAEQRIGAYRANCVKYVMRLDDKDTPIINAKKLLHYAQKLVEVLGEGT